MKISLLIQLFISIFYNYLNCMETIKVEHLPLVKIQNHLEPIVQNQDESDAYPLAAEAFLNKILQIEDSLEDSSMVKGKKEKTKTKPIRRRRGKNSLQGKWTAINKLNYYKSILKFSTDNPHYKVSWKYWKPEKFYPKMVQQINKGQVLFRKDVIQCKSFDQRQRKQYFDSGIKLDMIELSLFKLKNVESEDKQARNILENYFKKQNEKSQHMILLQQQLMNLKSEKLQLDELFDDVISRNKKHTHKNWKQNCLNNCFYY